MSPRFLKLSAYLFVVAGAFKVGTVAVTYFGEAPPWNRADRIGEAFFCFYVAWLQFELIRLYRKAGE